MQHQSSGGCWFTRNSSIKEHQETWFLISYHELTGMSRFADDAQDVREKPRESVRLLCDGSTHERRFEFFAIRHNEAVVTSMLLQMVEGLAGPSE